MKITLGPRPLLVSILVLFVTACGAPESGSDLYEANSEEASGKVFALLTESGYLVFSAPQTVNLITFCDGNDAINCGSDSSGYGQASLVGTKNGRKIFSKSFTVPTAGIESLSIRAYTNGDPILSVIRFAPKAPETPTIASQEFTWKGLLMTGDNSISAFDNARKKMRQLFLANGMKTENLKELSRRSSEQVAGVKPVSDANIKSSLEELDLGPNDGCLIHMTSHGSRQGFFIRDQNTLTPRRFAEILDNTCGERPTVVLVSACYSGVFIKEQTMLKKNRIILTAARADRTSFGCSPENEYTYWDNCLIEHFPKTSEGAKKSWKSFQEGVVQCINRKEGETSSSKPQGYFGESMTDLGMFGDLVDGFQLAEEYFY